MKLELVAVQILGLINTCGGKFNMNGDCVTGVCPDSFHNISSNPNSCYFISIFTTIGAVNFSNAQAACESVNATIWEPNNEQEITLVTQHAGTASFWIGVTDNEEEGNATYLSSGDPFLLDAISNNVQNNCVVLVASLFIFIRCSDTTNYICEKHIACSSSHDEYSDARKPVLMVPYFTYICLIMFELKWLCL